MFLDTSYQAPGIREVDVSLVNNHNSLEFCQHLFYSARAEQVPCWIVWTAQEKYPRFIIGHLQHRSCIDIEFLCHRDNLHRSLIYGRANGIHAVCRGWNDDTMVSRCTKQSYHQVDCFVASIAKED